MSFTIAIGRLVAKANGNVEKAVRQGVVLAAQGIVLRTPVDTGRARANWVLGVGSVNVATTAVTDKDGALTLSKIAAGLPRSSAGQIIYVTNTLPYIQRLEDGWSKQAPAGMVKSTLAGLPAAIERYAGSLR
jgi:hypothetical protein